jgi:hypothetical protein
MHAQTDTDAAREFADIVGDPFEHLQRILTPTARYCCRSHDGVDDTRTSSNPSSA